MFFCHCYGVLFYVIVWFCVAHRITNDIEMHRRANKSPVRLKYVVINAESVTIVRGSILHLWFFFFCMENDGKEQAKILPFSLIFLLYDFLLLRILCVNHCFIAYYACF
jgi:hypothetical protein